MAFELIHMQIGLQPNFQDMMRSWNLTEIFIMAKHDGMQKACSKDQR